jgi:hypothetical protein
MRSARAVPFTVAATLAAAISLPATAVGTRVVNRAAETNCMPGSTDPSYCEPPMIDGKPVTGQSNTSATAKVSTSSAGEVLVAFVRSDSPSPSGNSSSVTGGGLAWRRVAQENRALGDAEAWTATAGTRLSSVPITAKATNYSGYDEVLTVIAFEGATGIGAHGTFFSTRGAPTGTIKTTRPNSWVFAAGDDWLRSVGRTPRPGQKIQQESYDSGGDTYWVQSTSAPTAAAGTSVTINDTAPTSDPYDLVLVEVR